MSDPFIHFKVMVKERASDLILREGERPAMRCEGKIRFLSDERFTPEDAEALLAAILSAEEVAAFKVLMEKDVAFVVPGVGRFRANLFVQRRRYGFVFRHVQERVPKIEDLHLPVAPLTRLSRLHRGIVLVTGIAGSGKSTTLSALVEHMNEHTDRHIVTIEDPVEFIFRDKRCAITQREIGIDTPDYATALKHVVRQTPDVILLGEMRDRETIESALQAAESGHLVLSTLHTVNAVQTVERIISFFPPHQHQTIRLQLALVLEGVVSQRLITRRAAAGRVPAVEILLGTPTIKEMLLEGKTRDLSKLLDEGHEHYGTQTFNQSLRALVAEGLIDYDDALAAADNPDELMLAMRGIGKGLRTVPSFSP
ncbi:MAG: PilT/PilU family type 4a pilus ATPase [Planctomycetota bacterium]